MPRLDGRFEQAKKELESDPNILTPISSTREAADRLTILTTPEAIQNSRIQDPGMPRLVSGNVVVEVAGQANLQIQNYIIANSRQDAGFIPGQSPYTQSNAALNSPVLTNTPTRPAILTAGCAYGDSACASGVGVQQNVPLTQGTLEGIADGASVLSRQAGVVAAGATAVTAASPVQVKPISGAVAAGATAIGVGADIVEQLVRPNIGQAAVSGSGLIVQTLLEHTGPGKLVTPITNEAIEATKASAFVQSIQDWINEKLRAQK